MASGGWCVLSVLALVLALAASSTAMAQDQEENPEVIEKVTNLNKKALDSYNNLDFEEARKTLKQALDLCATSGLDNHPVAARTHIHMGVVLIAAKQQELGIKQFKKAIEIQPDIQVTKSLANPEIIQAFQEAGQSAGTPPPGGATTPPAPGGEGGEGGPKPAEGEPAKPAEDLSHTPVTHGKKGKPIAIIATVSPDLKGYTKVVLSYRAEGAEEFTDRDMKGAGNKFIAEIPVEATAGNLVAYYIEAEAEDESAVATAGTEEKPFVVALTPDAGAVAEEECNPEVDECEDDDEAAGPPIYFGVMGGLGFGYATGYGEVNADNKVGAGFASAGVAQLTPEAGYFIRPYLRLSLQLRYQIISGTTPLYPAKFNATGCGADGVCPSASGALAVLGRASWFFGSGLIRPYFSFVAGGGQIRHVVKFPTLKNPAGTGGRCGENGDQTCVDTVLAGPILVGPGGGVLFALTPRFGIVVEVSSVLAFPKFTYNLDLNAGVSVRI